MERDQKPRGNTTHLNLILYFLSIFAKNAALASLKIIDCLVYGVFGHAMVDVLVKWEILRIIAVRYHPTYEHNCTKGRRYNGLL